MITPTPQAKGEDAFGFVAALLYSSTTATHKYGLRLRVRNLYICRGGRGIGYDGQREKEGGNNGGGCDAHVD